MCWKECSKSTRVCRKQEVDVWKILTTSSRSSKPDQRSEIANALEACGRRSTMKVLRQGQVSMYIYCGVGSPLLFSAKPAGVAAFLHDIAEFATSAIRTIACSIHTAYNSLHHDITAPLCTLAPKLHCCPPLHMHLGSIAVTSCHPVQCSISTMKTEWTVIESQPRRARVDGCKTCL